MSSDKPILFVFLLLLGASFQCVPTKQCREIKYYIKNVDTLKPFRVEGTYCFKIVKDTLVRENTGLVRLNIYDRAGGTKINAGSVWFSEDIKFSFSNGFLEVNVPEGIYNINIYSFDPHLPFGIKALEVSSNNLIEINCFIGNSLQY